MMKFTAHVYYADHTLTCETYDMDALMEFLKEHEKVHCEVISALTGEVLFIANCPGTKDYMERQFMFLCTGWGMFKAMAEEEKAQSQKAALVREIQEVCDEFGATLHY